MRWLLVVWLLVACAGCGQSTPSGACLLDYDCEPDQLCGLTGTCLKCSNCDRGRVGTCTAPVWPVDRQPDEIRVEEEVARQVLVYVYICDGAASEYRYDRPDGDPCFFGTPRVTDGCNLTP